jgi:phosphoglycerate dehydrogenase-like enzyme
MKLRAIFLLDAETFPLVFGAAEQAELAAALDYAVPPLTAAQLETAPGPFDSVEAILSSWSVPVMDEKMLARFPRLRVVFHAAGTVKPFVTEALWRRGIRVSSAARVNAIPVAEFTLSQVIFCLKHGWQRVFEVRAGTHFRRQDESVPGTYGSTVGLISLGHTGRLVAERLRPLEVNVIAYDPHFPIGEAAKLGVELCGLDEVFARSDIVSCHTPLLPETTGLVRERHFALMRRGASFLNTARGAVVDEGGMISVLQRRPDLFAVLDVTWPEPPGADSPLRALPNVVLTPHIAGSLGGEYLRIGRMVVEEVRRYARGEPMLGEVTPDQIPLIA